MPDVTGAYVRGLLLAQEIVPDPAFPGAAASPSYREASPVPGLPVPGRTTRLRLEASGTPSGTTPLEVRCQHADLPGQVDPAATIATRRQGEPLWVGWEQGGTISGWEPITYDAATAEEEPSICTLTDGRMVAVARQGAAMVTWTRSAGGTWGAGVTITPATQVYWPSIGAIGDELYILAWRRGYEGIAGAAYAIGVWRSADAGATWIEVQDFATMEEDVRGGPPPFTGAGLTVHAGRIRWAWRDGQVCVLAHVTYDNTVGHLEAIRQWSGASLAARLTLIGTYGGASKGWALPDVVATSSGFLVSFIEEGTGLLACTLGSMRQPLSSTTRATLVDSATSPTFGVAAGITQPVAGRYNITGVIGLAMVADPAGPAWFYWLSGYTAASPTAGRMGVVYSPDGGATATAGVYGYWCWYPHDLGGGATQGNRPYQIAGSWHQGRPALVHGWFATVGAYDSSVAVLFMGGWSDLTLPYAYTGQRIGHRLGWGTDWLPFERPDDQDYTLFSSGTSSSALVSPDGEDQLLTGDGAGANGQRYFERQGTGPLAVQYGYLELDHRVTTDGATATPDIGATLRLASVNAGIEIEICLDQTAVGVRDVVAGAPLAGSPFGGLVLGTSYQFRLGMHLVGDTGAGRQAQLWYRATSGASDRRWTALGQWTLQDDGGGGNDPYEPGGPVPFPRVSRFRAGHIASSGAATQRVSRWRRWHFSLPGIGTGATTPSFATWHDLNQAGGDNPGKLPGRPLGTEAVWATGDFTIAGRRGPAWIGDTWTIPITGEYSMARAISRTSPSPRIGWRSIGLVTDQELGWAADPDNPWLEDCAHPQLVGVGLYGRNARRVRVDSRSAAGVWTTRIDAATFVLSAVEFGRLGNAVIPAGGATATWLHKDECAGWYALLDNGAGTLRYRRIVGNEAGRWSAAGTDPMAVLYLDGVATTDPLGGGAHRLSIWPDSCVALFPGVTCAGWRIYWDNAYPTLEGDFREGGVFWLHAHLFGVEYSRGRTIEQIPGHERADLEGGIPVTTTRAPMARVFDLSWDEGVYDAEVHDAAATRWIRHSTNAGVGPNAAMAETAVAMRGLLARHGGNPMVYMQVADVSSATTMLLLRREEHALVTCDGKVKTINVEGNEERGEFNRFSMTLAEVK